MGILHYNITTCTKMQWFPYFILHLGYKPYIYTPVETMHKFGRIEEKLAWKLNWGGDGDIVHKMLCFFQGQVVHGKTVTGADEKKELKGKKNFAFKFCSTTCSGGSWQCQNRLRPHLSLQWGCMRQDSGQRWNQKWVTSVGEGLFFQSFSLVITI